MKKISLSDIPLEESLNDFGTEGYVQGLERFITYAASPITIALQGEWGSGKTSLMNQLYNDLCTEGNDFVGININTWEYSMLASPEETVLKIIGQLIDSITQNDSKANSKGRQYMNMAMNGLYRFGREFLKGMFPGAGLIVEAAGTATERPNFDSESEKHTVSITELKRVLTDAINKTIEETNKKGILVFVDDLDRLNPPVAVQILELLKNIFTLDNCIFILAIDYDVVVKGLEPKFGKISDANEREFRSFFDKIIQVPFSLPVNNYKPMKFVLDSLVSVGYITSGEKSIPYMEKNIEKIVVSSVGKNPRSIKRLINTLSLLDCIGKCASKESLPDSMETKIINFSIVALQVCYPKIYNILSLNPIFNNWDGAIASKLNLHIDKEAISDINGEVILDALCEKDIYLSKHHKEIINLLDIIYSNALKVNKENPSDVIKKILDRSSITNVNVTVESEELDRKSLIYKLHDNVWNYMSKKVPDMKKPQFKRNTGNGGYFIFLPDDSYFEVVFQPTLVEKIVNNSVEKMITLNVWMQTYNRRPDRLKDIPYENVIADKDVVYIITPLYEIVTKYSEYGMIEGKTYDGIIFKNVFEEFKYRRDELWDAITGDTQYWFNLKSASDFEDFSIVSAIGDLIIGAYELNNRALNLR